jgi:two-component system, NtrC family, response regulator AtoC
MHTALVALGDRETREAIETHVKNALWRAVTVSSCGEARRRFPGRDFDVVFAEAPRAGGEGWCRAVHACRVAVLVDLPDHAGSEGPLPAGFHARLAYPFEPDAVTAILDSYSRTEGPTPNPPAAVAVGAEAGEPSGPRAGGSSGTRMLGDSPAIRRVSELVRVMAPASAPVLITGETGTGKEVAARQLHEFSRRRDGPFVAVNCGALSPTLMDSQLFGHERGSFSGAERRHRGLFERADGGTLFLDEITEMPSDFQVKFLRVLEQGEFHRTGGEEVVSVNVRPVAATNRDPKEAIAEGRLRPDLYYRLRVLHLPIPPLRGRGQDVELLAREFLHEIAVTEGEPRIFTVETLACLRGHSWPGNVRELRNAVYTAYLMSEGREITPDALPSEVVLGAPLEPQQEVGEVRVRVGTSIEEAERRLILRTLGEEAGNKTRAAEALGISLKTLYNRLNSYQSDGSGPGRIKVPERSSRPAR